MATPPHEAPVPPAPEQVPVPARRNRVSAHEFYGPDAPPPPPKDAFLRRVARDPYRLGGFLLVAGFWSVFVSQTNIIHQIVLGAPIFEEFFKFGLALVTVTWLGLKAPLLRWVVALWPGVGFGVLEHYVSYADLDTPAFFAVRVGFHASASALSVACYDALVALGDVRVRWGSTAAASLVHYTFNVAAIGFGIATVAIGDSVFGIQTAFAGALSAGVLVLGVMIVAWPETIQNLARRRFPDPAPVTFNPAAGPAASLAQPASATPTSADQLVEPADPRS